MRTPASLRRAPGRRGRAATALVLALAAGAAAGAGPALEPPRFTREQMEGAIADAPPFRFVYGTRVPASAPLLRARALALALRAFGGDSSQVVADRDADERAIAAGPVFLLGGPGENEWTRRLAPALPVSFDAGGFTWRGKRYDRPLDAIHLAWPNPLAPKRFLLLSAGNSPAALVNRSGGVLLDDDWRIVRDGVVARNGRFAQEPASPWRYEPRLDRDREAEALRFTRSLATHTRASLVLRAPAGLAEVPAVAAAGESLLERMARDGLAQPPGLSRPTLTLYRSLEEKGTFTQDTHPEHASGPPAAPAAHAALPFGRKELDLRSVAALRLLQCGGSPASRFFAAGAASWARRFEGESLERSIARLYFGGVLPTASEAATRDPAWRTPLVWTPARALLVRAVWESARPPARRDALLALLRQDPPGTLDSLCRTAGVAAAAVERRYRALADSLARAGRREPGPARREPWRPAQGFQRGVCLAHAVGLERGYLSAACAHELQRVRDAGADWVSLTPFAWLADPHVPVLGNSTDSGPDGESDEAIAEAAARAHALGLRVWLKPHVWTRGWAGEVTFGAAGWQRFFESYGDVLLHWAIVAEREGLDGLFVGHELASSTAAAPERWRTLIGTVRRVYGGTLSYCANWDEAARVPFWDALDVVGVSFYAPLGERTTREPSRLRAGAAQALAGLRAVSRRSGRPVLLAELGYPRTVNAAVRPWDDSPAAPDPELQSLCLDAAVAAMDPDDWLAGAYFWKWGSSARAGKDLFDARGRPAEAALTRALKNWQGRPVRALQAAEEQASGSGP